MKNLLFITFFTCAIFSLFRAQSTLHKAISIGYVYQNQSFGEIGGKLLFVNTDDQIFRIGATALLGSTAGNFAIMPKIQADYLLNFEKNVDFMHSYYFLAGAEVTSKYVAPKIGVAFFGIFDLTAGYAFSIDKKGLFGKELSGLNLNITLNIPTVALHDMFKR